MSSAREIAGCFAGGTTSSGCFLQDVSLASMVDMNVGCGGEDADALERFAGDLTIRRLSRCRVLTVWGYVKALPESSCCRSDSSFTVRRDVTPIDPVSKDLGRQLLIASVLNTSRCCSSSSGSLKSGLDLSNTRMRIWEKVRFQSPPLSSR